MKFKEILNKIKEDFYSKKPVETGLTKKKLNPAQTKTYKGYAATMSYVGHEKESDHAILKDKEGNYVRVDRLGKAVVHFKD